MIFSIFIIFLGSFPVFFGVVAFYLLLCIFTLVFFSCDTIHTKDLKTKQTRPMDPTRVASPAEFEKWYKGAAAARLA